MTRLLRLAGLSLILCCASARSDSSWQSTAGAAVLLAPGQVDGVERALVALPHDARDQAQRLLAKVTGQQPGVAGARAAYYELQTGLPAVTIGQPTKGTDPAQAAVLGAAQVWFQGFLVQSGQAVAAGPDPATHAAELLALVESMILWSPGVRATLRAEARQGLGDALYGQALQAMGGE